MAAHKEWIAPFSPTILRAKLESDALSDLLALSDHLLGLDPHEQVPEPAPVLSQVKMGLQIEPQRLGLAGQALEALMTDYLHRVLTHLDAEQYLGAFDIQDTEGQILSAWFSYQYAGDFVPVHKHSTPLAGAVYLKIPENMQSAGPFAGQISFSDGRHQEFVRERLDITPEVGDVLIFPGWLNHQVYPFKGPGERRMLSFNGMMYRH